MGFTGNERAAETVAERKTHTGYEKSVDGFEVPIFFVRRMPDGLYDVYVNVLNGRTSLLGFSFGNKPEPKNQQIRIFTGISTRQEAISHAKLARDQLFSLLATQINSWAANL